MSGTTLDRAGVTPGTYELDPDHTTIGFVARHLMVTRVRGRFTSFAGSLHIGDSPESSSAEVTIDSASIDTRSEQRDAHLRSPDFFDVGAHPRITFATRALVPLGDDRYEVTGDLTIKGVTHPVVLAAVFEGEAVDPWGNRRIGFSATAEVDREDWGLTWNVPLEGGGWLVGRKVTLEIEGQAILEPRARAGA